VTKKRGAVTNRGASVRARLLALAKERGDSFDLVLVRYAIERFLYRLSISPEKDRFWLKGGQLFQLWFNAPHRPTRDADFLGFGSADQANVEAAIREVCLIAHDDGIAFDPESIQIVEIAEDKRYPGLRVTFIGTLDGARCPMQLDIGYGDAVTPGPDEVDYPTLLADQPAPRLRIYRRATVIAEKVEAIVYLGMANSRMKDYFDLLALANENAVDADDVGRAIGATFQRRRTDLPEAGAVPIGLSDDFARDAAKTSQWKAFLAKNKLKAPSLPEVVEKIRAFLDEPFRKARSRRGDR